jgi:hypothetical protein
MFYADDEVLHYIVTSTLAKLKSCLIGAAICYWISTFVIDRLNKQSSVPQDDLQRYEEESISSAAVSTIYSRKTGQ